MTTIKLPRSWWNGEADARPPVTSRGLHYGDGVFRTMLLHEGTVIEREAQLAKLAADAALLGLEAPASLGEELDRCITGFQDGVLKLMLIRAGADRGYRPSVAACDRLLLLYPPLSVPSAQFSNGIAAIRSPVTLGSQPSLAGIKHLNRLEQVLASRDWPETVSEAILGDERGNPICGTRSNVFWVTRGVLTTPALDRCGVAGLTRARLLAIADRIQLPVRVAAMPWSALESADEAFVCNSLVGIWPLRALNERRWFDVGSGPGPVTRNLIQALAHPTLRVS